MLSDPRIRTATGLMIGVTILAAIDSVIVRVLTEDLHPFTIVFFRSFFGLLWVAPWILRDRRALQSNYVFLHVVRAGLKMLSLFAFFTAIAAATLADVTAIAFTTPIFLTIGAWVFLKEPVVFKRVLAVVAGFAGALIILQPGQAEWSTPLLYALLGALLTAIIQLILKSMSAKDSTETLVAWNLIVTVPMAAIPLYWFWSSPSLENIALLALQGALGACNMAFMARALSLVQASYLAPLDFLRLPIVAILAYLFFAEIPTFATVIGGVVIFSSSLLLAKSSVKAA